MLDNTSTVKLCSKCKIEQSLDNFYKNKSRKDGLADRCKRCEKEYKKDYYLENSEKLKNNQKEYYLVNAEKIIEYQKEYRKIHTEKISNDKKEYQKINAEKIKESKQRYQKINSGDIKKRKRIYYLKHAEKIISQQKDYYLENSEKIIEYQKGYRKTHSKKIIDRNREYTKEKRKTDVNFKLACNLRRRLSHALRENSKSMNTLKLLGCPVLWLNLHLGSKFYSRKNGESMSWNNYGIRGWHVDHIKPCASFDLSDPIEQQKCFHWTNLQPLWAEDNLAKSDMIL